MDSAALPVDPPPPEDTILQVRLLEDEDEARKIARELHTATHLGGHALWKVFRDRYSHKANLRICLETTQSCPQCQLSNDYGPPPEDNRHHPVPRPMGYAVHRRCGPSSSRPPPRVPDCLCGLLFQVHHPHPFQQPHRKYSQRSPYPPYHPLLLHIQKAPLRLWQGVH